MDLMAPMGTRKEQQKASELVFPKFGVLQSPINEVRQRHGRTLMLAPFALEHVDWLSKGSLFLRIADIDGHLACAFESL